MEQPQVYNFDGNNGYGYGGWGGIVPGFLGGILGGALFGGGFGGWGGNGNGDAAFLLAEDICEHGCVHCRKDER